MKWVRFFSSLEELESELGSRKSLCLKVQNKDLILHYYQNNYFLIKNKCPHQGLPMKDSHCEDGHVVCPFHQYKFSLETGRGHGLYLDQYPVKITNEGVFAGFEYFSIF
jgi:nitrite reductase/ring-hydroxylating ferredoxin subunit